MAFMTFESTQIECIHMDNQIWVRGVQIGEALEYTNRMHSHGQPDLGKRRSDW